MELEKVKDKLRKLIAHEKSAKKVGNYDEARMYKAAIDRLLRKYNLTRKALNAPPPLESYSGDFSCSCGFSISLHISAGATTAAIASQFLAPHQQPGHKLTRK